MPSAIPDTERAFEALIVSEMTADGRWLGGDPVKYDTGLGLYTEDVIAFVTEAQPRQWERLVRLVGDEESAGVVLIRRLAGQLDRHGSVKVLREGITERGLRFSMCQLRPAHSIDPETADRYEANRLRVVRQVRYDASSGDSVDLVLFVNGVPTATAELKNRWTGQTVEDAIRQYRTDRDPANILFSKRALVHFAVDAELAYMTTRLDGDKSVFLPFNQGSAGPGEPGGAGNPGVEDGHPTAYLWREIWDRDLWLELIQKFVHIELADPEGKGSEPATIFPRYHQWHVVVQCQAHARVHGPGQNYLIQHSAGSGKTKEIAWLAHDLSTLHRPDDTKVFDKVIVITDRRVLDRQMRRQIAEFEQVEGVVRSVTQSSSELQEALRTTAAKIVTTTLQKFPFVLKALDEDEALSDKSYAIVVDEAHSSQSGEAVTDLKQMLGGLTPEDLDLDEDDGTPPALLARLAARGRQPNLSFFAFTATPKGKTLELFGTKAADGTARAFHTYSMRQAIAERFIVDVLANYTTYEQLYRLETEAETLEVPSGRTSSRLARFAELHPHVKSQKAAVVVDHFRRVVRPLLGGEGKAMVVCEGREEAVQWKRALDREIERTDDDLKALVAFSGEIEVSNRDADNVGATYTEPEMNRIDGQPLPEGKLPDEFGKPEYGLLVVAEKYQTGFDQPRLCGMYVDKVLAGVNAVQTLSRLNRAHPGKEAVYVLDFRNTEDQIRKAFEPFYGKTEAAPTDPNVLFDAADAVRGFNVISDEDLERFVDGWSRLERVPEDRRHALLSTLTQAPFLAAQELEQEERRRFRDELDRFVRVYGYLSQALSWIPPETEVLFQLSKTLRARLRSESPDGGVDLSGAVSLTHYRLSAHGEVAIELGTSEVAPLSAIGGNGSGGAAQGGQISMAKLGELIELLNARHGGDLDEADALELVTNVREAVAGDHPELEDQARVNSRRDFVAHRDDLLIDAALSIGSGQKRQAKLLKVLLDDDDFRTRVGELIFGSLYDAYAADKESSE
jgi:type I restriction enzyme, R subunit